MLTRSGISSKIDDSGQTIGKRYARTDECGIPFAITVDFDTLKDESVTLRDLHTMKQVRMNVNTYSHTFIIFINKSLYSLKNFLATFHHWQLATRLGTRS